MRLAAVSLLALALAACDAGEAPSADASAPEADAAIVETAAAPDASAEAAPTETAAVDEALLVYPDVATVDQVDVLHGVDVADPYRWLEDDVRVNPEVAAFVEAENAVTDAYLETLPTRAAIRARMHEIWNHERFGVPEEAGGRLFFERNDGLQNQDVLYVKDGVDAEPTLVLDPNTWSDDGATALAAFVPSPDGTNLVYSIQDGGSDWRTLKVVAVGEDGAVTPLDDTVEWVKFSSIVWAEGGYGFFYARYPAPEEGAEFQNLNFNQKVYFHTLGEAQDQDRLVYERPENPEQGFGLDVPEGGRYLLVTVWQGTDDRYELVLIDLEDWERAPVTLVSGFENDYALAGADGDTLYLRTNRGAPKGRVIAMNVIDSAEENWVEIVPERPETLVDASYVGGKIIAEYLKDAVTDVRLFAADGSGETGAIALPGLGVASGFEGRGDDPVTYYTFSSLNRPATVYRANVATGETTTFAEPDLPFDPDDFVVEQVFYPSKDGTEIPMFFAYKRGLAHDGAAPTLLYGYGGFNISSTPYYRADRLAWMDMGGLYASANLRGGGEYGAAWHDAGRLLNKQNVFDDFAAAADYLIAEGWTSPEHLAIYGRSNGGLLVGATVNQHPELFAAALPQVGVMDMLRFNQFTAGRFWTDDYGDPAEPEHFANLYAYSPYHNIRSGADYPAIMALTADTDDRVVPGHTFKYIAALQAADTGDAPKIVRIDTRAGHGSGKPVDKQIEEWADMWAFIAAHTGLELPEGYGG